MRIFKIKTGRRPRKATAAGLIPLLLAQVLIALFCQFPIRVRHPQKGAQRA